MVCKIPISAVDFAMKPFSVGDFVTDQLEQKQSSFTSSACHESYKPRNSKKISKQEE